MSRNFGRKLYAMFRQSAGPLAFRDVQTRVSTFWADAVKAHHPGTSPGLFVRNYRANVPPSQSSRQLSKRFASGGFLVLGLSPNSTATVESSASCAIASADKIVSTHVPRCCSNPRLPGIARQAWRRSLHTSRSESGKAADKTNEQMTESAQRPAQEPSSSEGKRMPAEEPHESSRLDQFRDRLPNLSQIHRPTKEELLAAATGFWSRLRIRFKWFSIRSVRPFNLDEISALFSWVLLGHVLWIILGTTTFFSLVILAINTVFAQGLASQHFLLSAGVCVDRR